MPKLTMPELIALKGQRPISWMTAYDYIQAQLVEAAEIDVILVGDSLGMTTLGFNTTLPVTMDHMVHHSAAVRRGAPVTMMIVDLPFLSFTTPTDALRHSGRLIQESLADGVKLEGGTTIIPVVQALVRESIPVVGHLGLTPQSVHRMGGYKVQARSAHAIYQLVEDAKRLSDAGVGAIVLEGIPDRVATYVTEVVSVPTIGIGAGAGCDGQVLVFHDCLGLSSGYPKFARPFADLRTTIVDGLSKFRQEVEARSFPNHQETYHVTDREWNQFMALTDDPTP